MRPTAFAALLAAVLLAACGGAGSPLGGDGAGDVEARILSLERRLTTTCACHPRDIEGLPIQGRIREDLRAWIAEGRDDRDILWLGFTRYGSELLAAGITDLESQVRLAGWITAIIAALGLTLLVANLRRNAHPETPPGASPDPRG